MTRSGPERRRRWWLIVVLALAGTMAAVPIAAVAHHLISQAIGRTTVASDADGTDRTVYWRDYPGIAGADPQEILQGPTPDEGYAAGRKMVAEIKTALSTEFRLDWAPEDDLPASSIFQERVQNSFGGQSLLTVVNSPESQSTSVPTAWADKERVLSIIGEITDRHGYRTPTINPLDSWSDEDRIRDLGGLTPDKQVIVAGMVQGPAGQWLSFRFQDLSKDADGRFEERLRPPEGTRWQMNTVALSYGANGLLPGDDRDEFRDRLEPYLGLTPPDPLES